MCIEGEELTVGDGAVSWVHHDLPITVFVGEVGQAMSFAGAVLVLDDGAPGTRVLCGFSHGGEALFRVGPPAGFEFSYLTGHPEVGAAVVCGGAVKIDNWYDWHFSVDLRTGRLERHCPAC